ncbi:MAG: cyclic nucleotide-binding protein, partial [bacterium]
MLEKIDVATGVSWVGIPEADLYLLCGCPADAVKHLMRRGLILTKHRDGVSFETGPNAILLSDLPVQHGSFANLSEFPVLQMFYRQGMLVPGHRN